MDEKKVSIFEDAENGFFRATYEDFEGEGETLSEALMDLSDSLYEATL